MIHINLTENTMNFRTDIDRLNNVYAYLLSLIKDKCALREDDTSIDDDVI